MNRNGAAEWVDRETLFSLQNTLLHWFLVSYVLMPKSSQFIPSLDCISLPRRDAGLFAGSKCFSYYRHLISSDQQCAIPALSPLHIS